MKEYPEGFPLSPLDSEGNALKEGDKVNILQVPDWLIHDLDEESQEVIKGCEGQLMTIYEIDDYGYMWVEKPVLETEEEYESHSFCMEPKNLLRHE